ncbi:MAG: hypothetical protein K0Q49_29 [Haloplasmataceae bacterium]|jgi:hypothetical protein|nr:hypothetical protein [Haloplasmataceae bacterium]
MNLKFEEHISEIIKFMKKMFIQTMIIAIVFSFFTFLFIYMGMEFFSFTFIFFLLLTIFFYALTLLGFKRRMKFIWILNNYKTDKEKCIILLRLKNKNLKKLKEGYENHEMMISDYMVNIITAYEILTSEE